MLASGFSIGGLVDTDRAEATVGFLDHIGSDPADTVGHILTAAGRAARREFEFLSGGPGPPAENDIVDHGFGGLCFHGIIWLLI